MMQTLERKQKLIDAGVEGQRNFAESSISMQTEFLRYLRESV
jgi:hypothetical protein